MPNFMIEILAYMIMAFFASIPFIITYCVIRVVVNGRCGGMEYHAHKKKPHGNRRYTPSYKKLSDPMTSSLGSRLPHNVFNTSYRTDRY